MSTALFEIGEMVEGGRTYKPIHRRDEYTVHVFDGQKDMHPIFILTWRDLKIDLERLKENTYKALLKLYDY